MATLIYGTIKDSTGAAIDGANFQCWFRNTGGGSPSTWGPVKTTRSDGTYDVTLQDDDWLTGDASVADGDQVLVAAWTGVSTTRNDVHPEFSFAYITLAGEDSYEVSFRTQIDQAPRTGVRMDSASLLRRLSSAQLTELSTASSTYDDTSGPPGGGERTWYQRAQYGGENIFSVAVGISEVDVDWEWPAGDTGIISSGGSETHQYTTVGAKHIWTRSRDLANQIATDTDEFDIVVDWRLPVPGLSWSPPSGITISTEVTFTPEIVDPDDRVASVDYYVDDVLVQTGLGEFATWLHTFSSNGAIPVRQVVHYLDYLDADQTVEEEFTVTVENVGPTVGWTLNPAGRDAALYVWTSDATDPDGTIDNYSWTLEQGAVGWTTIASLSGPDHPVFSYAFTSEGTYRLTHTVTDNNGLTDTQQEEFVVTITDRIIIETVKASGFIRYRSFRRDVGEIL